MIQLLQEFKTFGITVRHDVLTSNPAQHKIYFIENAEPRRDKSIIFSDKEWKDEKIVKEKLSALLGECMRGWGLV